MESREIIIIGAGDIGKSVAARIAALKAEGHLVTIITPEEAKKRALVENLSEIIETTKIKEETVFELKAMPAFEPLFIPERRDPGKGRNKMQWRGKNKRKR